MSDESRHLESLRDLERCQAENAKLKHKLQMANLLDQRKQEELEDLKAQLALKDSSLVHLAQFNKITGDSFNANFIVIFFKLIFDFYNQLSHARIQEIVEILKKGPTPYKIIGNFVERPKHAFNVEEIASELRAKPEQISDWLDILISTGEIVEFEDNSLQVRQTVIEDVFSYKDLTKLTIEELFIDVRKKIALARDSRAYKNILGQLEREIERRNLGRTLNDLKRIQADVGLGLRKADWIFEQLAKTIKLAEQEEITARPTPPSPTKFISPAIRQRSMINVKMPDQSKYPSKPVFTPKPIPKRPSAFHVTMTKSGEETTSKIATARMLRPEMQVSTSRKELAKDIEADQQFEAKQLTKTPSKESQIQVAFSDYEEIQPDTNTYEIFEEIRTGIKQSNNLDETLTLLTKLRNSLGQIKFSRVLYSIANEISHLKAQKNYNKEEVLALLDQWQNY